MQEWVDAGEPEHNHNILLDHTPRGADGLALVPMRLDLEANPVAIPVVASL